jgi:hypothetical protein
MEEVRGRNPWSWRDELASLVEDSGVRYAGDPLDFDLSSTASVEVNRSPESGETLKEQALGFFMAWFEILLELGRGCRDILRQNLINDDSFLVRKLRGPCAKVSKRLSFLNDYLPEDRDPVHAWSVVFFVFILALAGFLINLLPYLLYAYMLYCYCILNVF